MGRVTAAIVTVGAIGALFLAIVAWLAWWINVGSARRALRQAHDATVREFREIHGPDWQPPHPLRPDNWPHPPRPLAPDKTPEEKVVSVVQVERSPDRAALDIACAALNRIGRGDPEPRAIADRALLEINMIWAARRRDGR